MYADLLKYLAVALLIQVALLLLAGGVTYGLVQYESNVVLLPVMIAFIVYAWPLAPFGFGAGLGSCCRHRCWSLSIR